MFSCIGALVGDAMLGFRLSCLRPELRLMRLYLPLLSRLDEQETLRLFHLAQLSHLASYLTTHLTTDLFAHHGIREYFRKSQDLQQEVCIPLKPGVISP